MQKELELDCSPLSRTSPVYTVVLSLDCRLTMGNIRPWKIYWFSKLHCGLPRRSSASSFTEGATVSTGVAIDGRGSSSGFWRRSGPHLRLEIVTLLSLSFHLLAIIVVVYTRAQGTMSARVLSRCLFSGTMSQGRP